MKKPLFIFSILLCIIILTSCTSDDSVENSSIMGAWKLTEWNVKTPLDLNNDGIASTNLLTEFGCLDGSELVFNDVNSGTILYTSDVGFHTGFDEEESQIFMMICGTDSERLAIPFTYSINENIVTITVSGELVNLTLEGNTLSLFVQDGFVAYDINTFEVSVIQDATYVFTKE